MAELREEGFQKSENIKKLSPAWELETDVSILKLSMLDPFLKKEIQNILSSLTSKGWKPKIFYGFRSRKEQLEIVKRGHSKTKYSNHNVVIGNEKNPIPNSLAVDIIDKRYAWVFKQDKAADFFKALGAEAGYSYKDGKWIQTKDTGLMWGGSWSKNKLWRPYNLGWDPAHIELKSKSNLWTENEKLYGTNFPEDYHLYPKPK